jgi:hypothetical protein
VFAALLFAVHPMHTEAVSNITNLAELLSLCFQLCAFLLYVNVMQSTRASPATKGVTFIGVTLLCALAIGCKETGAMVLPVLAVHELLQSGLLTQIASQLYRLVKPLPHASLRCASEPCVIRSEREFCMRSLHARLGTSPVFIPDQATA